MNRRITNYIYDILITCFEIKVTKSDFHSSNGHNFVGNANYYVMPYSLYKEIKAEIPSHIGVIALQEGENIIQLKKVKECEFCEMSDNDRMWMILNILKRHDKEQSKHFYDILAEEQHKTDVARDEYWSLKQLIEED